MVNFRRILVKERETSFRQRKRKRKRDLAQKSHLNIANIAARVKFAAPIAGRRACPCADRGYGRSSTSFFCADLEPLAKAAAHLTKTDSTIAPPPKEKTGDLFNDRFMATRHARTLGKKHLHVFSSFQRTIER